MFFECKYTCTCVYLLCVWYFELDGGWFFAYVSKVVVKAETQRINFWKWIIYQAKAGIRDSLKSSPMANKYIWDEGILVISSWVATMFLCILVHCSSSSLYFRTYTNTTPTTRSLRGNMCRYEKLCRERVLIVLRVQHREKDKISSSHYIFMIMIMAMILFFEFIFWYSGKRII